MKSGLCLNSSLHTHTPTHTHPPNPLPLPLSAPEDAGNNLLSVGSFILKKTSDSTVILESTVQQTALKRRGELSSKQSV